MAEDELITQEIRAPDKPGWFERLRQRARRDKEWADYERAHIKKPLRWRIIKRVALVLAIILICYYPVGMIVTHKVDDDTAYAVTVKKGQSHAVAIAAALIDREVNGHGWTANDPFFLPSSQLDNMPNFQVGVKEAIARFTIEMADHIGRTRGSSPVDPDLEKARGSLSYDPRVWVFDFRKAWIVTESSERQYRRGLQALLSYNARLAAGKAVFERRSDNLQATLDRIAADLGSVSAQIDARIRDASGSFIDTRSDDVFYSAKGRIYGYYMVLTALGKDFAAVIKQKQLDKAWAQMLQSLKEAAELKPLIVRNGDAEGMFQPNHLTSQGFYLLRARTQLKEITNILLK